MIITFDISLGDSKTVSMLLIYGKWVVITNHPELN